MSNIYLEYTIEKKWRTQNFYFLILKSSTPGSIWGAPTHGEIIEFSKFLLQIKKTKNKSGS